MSNVDQTIKNEIQEYNYGCKVLVGDLPGTIVNVRSQITYHYVIALEDKSLIVAKQTELTRRK